MYRYTGVDLQVEESWDENQITNSHFGSGLTKMRIYIPVPVSSSEIFNVVVHGFHLNFKIYEISKATREPLFY